MQDNIPKATILEVREFVLSQPANRPVRMFSCENCENGCIVAGFTQSKGIHFDSCTFSEAVVWNKEETQSTPVFQIDYPVIAMLGSDVNYDKIKTYGDLQKVVLSEEKTMEFAKEIWGNGY